MAFGKRLMLFPAISICFCGLSFAVDRYVSLTGTNNSPYLNWPDAATNIQWAIDVSTTAGDTVWVSNGTYVLTNQITVNKANLVLRSVNGREVTVINANYTNRCMLISGANNAVVDGFTLTNGTVIGNGGGLYMDAALINPGVSNCIIAGNACSGSGGGVLIGAGTLQNCTISGNSINNSVSGGSGGGISASGGIITNCIINNNASSNVSSSGIGVYINSSSVTLANCIIAGNSSLPGGWGYGGGINMTAGLVQNCVISNNYMKFMSGGIYTAGGIVQNCIIISNRSSAYAGGATVDGTAIFRNNLVLKNTCPGSANQGGGGIWIYTASAIVANCTVVSNSVTGANSGGGVLAAAGGSCTNMIIYDNSSPVDPNFGTGPSTGYCSYSCSYPLITNGVGNITNNPQFVDSANNNYRLNMSSPCINTGTNQGWMMGAVDMDGHRRIDRLYGRVDMGAYEFIHKITLISGH